MKKDKISVALATYNEEENLGECLELVKDLADEIIIVDGSSQDKTVEIAKEYGAKVTITNNPPIFHINKQKALEACQGEWILQLDADERVTEALSKEIKMITSLSDKKINRYQKIITKRELFLRHQRIVEKRDGRIGQDKGEYAGFFVARLNYFLGKYLRYGGVYPDGVIRLVKNGKAHFPCQDVHEQIVIKGKVGWLQNDLLHYADTTFKKYLQRNSKYINLIVAEFKEKKLSKNPIQSLNYFLIKPIYWFFLTLFRHKGILDGFQGIVFSFFSALRFPRAYWRYLLKK
ncbi:MAG TPA: glycosyltransferase family 2 protein [Patescibacteria group bacterium]|nr:glycosyltransferase family 2 protein [Patescibacteria group bacterium]